MKTGDVPIACRGFVIEDWSWTNSVKPYQDLILKMQVP